MDYFVNIRNRERADQAAELEAVVLAFAAREKARQRVTLASGEDVVINLKRGTVMRGGQILSTADGRCIEVQAAAEPVSTVRAESGLVRIAYHLGNRHVPLQVTSDWVRYLADHVLDAMVIQLGGSLEHETAAFEPEAGAYGQHGHHHGHTHGAPT